MVWSRRKKHENFLTPQWDKICFEYQIIKFQCKNGSTFSHLLVWSGPRGLTPPHPSPFPTYGPVKRPFFTTSLWLNRWVFFMCFLPHFLESLKAPILSERSRISLNHISNINTIPRLKWISHNIRIIELFALYKCIPHPLPASWSHLMEQKYQWNINNFA